MGVGLKPSVGTLPVPTGECRRSLVFITMTSTILLLTFLSISLIHSQLIGSRGVIHLKAGYEYRDKQTVVASEAVAKYAKKYQPYVDNDSQRRKSRRFSVNQVQFPSLESRNKSGRKLRNSQIFDFQSSRLISPLAELRRNKPLEEIEIERSTSSARLLPNEILTVTKPSVIFAKVSKNKEIAGYIPRRKKLKMQQPKLSSKLNTSAGKGDNKKVPKTVTSKISRPLSYPMYPDRRTSIPVQYVEYGSRYKPFLSTKYIPDTYQAQVQHYHPGLLYSLVLTHLG